MANGIGNLEYANKDRYVGEFADGRKQGKGKYFFAEGTVFDGFWENDFKVEGHLKLFNGDEFEGVFKNNNRYKGNYKYSNGD